MQLKQIPNTQIFLIDDAQDKNKEAGYVTISKELLKQDFTGFKKEYKSDKLFNTTYLILLHPHLDIFINKTLDVYTDGSWRGDMPDVCGASAMIFCEGTLIGAILLNMKDRIVRESHHIVGELYSVAVAINLLKGIPKVIYHDYKGVENLIKRKKTKSKSRISNLYKAMLADDDLLRQTSFIHVKSHNDCLENHIADYYANTSRYTFALDNISKNKEDM